MAKKSLLKERNTNEDLYPITSIDCITDFPEGTLNLILSHDGTKPIYIDISALDWWAEY